MEPDPIFVVGLQRSGSTLIEQILASHPMIEGTAELMVLEQMWERLARLEARRRSLDGPCRAQATGDRGDRRGIS